MRIEREIINQFVAWKEAPVRKPILLKGARQIGKTWAMETAPLAGWMDKWMLLIKEGYS